MPYIGERLKRETNNPIISRVLEHRSRRSITVRFIILDSIFLLQLDCGGSVAL